MVVDGIEPETIQDIMDLEIGEMERRHGEGVDMLKKGIGSICTSFWYGRYINRTYSNAW